MKQKRIFLLLAAAIISIMLLGSTSAFAEAENNTPPASLNFVVVNDLNNLNASDLTEKFNASYGIPATAELVKRGDNVLFQITANGDGTLIPQVKELFNIGHVKTVNGGNDPWGLGFYIETGDYEVQFLQTYLSETYGNTLNKTAYLFDMEGYLVDSLPEVDSQTGLFIPSNFQGYLLFEMADSCNYSNETAEGFKQAVWWMKDMFDGDYFILDNFGYVTSEPEMKDKNSASPSPSSEAPAASPSPAEPMVSPSPEASPSEEAVVSPSPSPIQAASPSPSASEANSPESDNTFLIIAICVAAVIVIAVIIFVVIKKGKKNPPDTPASDNQQI